MTKQLKQAVPPGWEVSEESQYAVWKNKAAQFAEFKNYFAELYAKESSEADA